MDTVIKKQATINIGTIGHVSHGKTTIVHAISGQSTIRYKSERERNITIKLGYANAKIYKCSNCPRPGCYKSYGSTQYEDPVCVICGVLMSLQRHISFIDVPGHDSLMATMISGASIMDSAMLLVAANETCPQPQTAEHLSVVEIMNLPSTIIVQNKIDLVKENVAMDNYFDILRFIQGTKIQESPVIPISAIHNVNINVICEYLCHIPEPERELSSPPRLIIARSFDINKPKEFKNVDELDKLCGGVFGGSILKGILRIGDEIEIRPGLVSKENNIIKTIPIFSRVISLFAETTPLQYAVPGGLIAIGTNVDPTLTRANRLVGQVVGIPGTLPPVYIRIEIKYTILVTGEELVKNEIVRINIGTTSTSGEVVGIKNDLIQIYLSHPVCTEMKEKVAISRQIDKKWRLVGWGILLRGC